jgi:uncharacterized protein YjbI with pentapeptide repeats
LSAARFTASRMTGANLTNAKRDGAVFENVVDAP